MRRSHLASVFAGLFLAACGSDGIGNDTGGGSGTLLVNGTVEHNDGRAEFRVRVQLGGADVPNAGVTMESELGEVILVWDGNDRYRGEQFGWAEGYRLQVAIGEDHNLSGSVDAPGFAALVSPDPQVPFDPHLAENGVVRVSWDGERAMAVRVRTHSFDWGPFPDEGEVLVPATYFDEDQQDIEIDRENQVSLAGGLPGSTLSAQMDTDTRVTLINPF